MLAVVLTSYPFTLLEPHILHAVHKESTIIVSLSRDEIVESQGVDF